MLARGETPSACPAIDGRLSIERGEDGAYRLVVDGYTNGPPRDNIAPTPWPASGFESPARAVAEARARLRKAQGNAPGEGDPLQVDPERGSAGGGPRAPEAGKARRAEGR